MWRKYDAMSLATPEAFNNDPARVWQFYHYRREKWDSLSLVMNLIREAYLRPCVLSERAQLNPMLLTILSPSSALTPNVTKLLQTRRLP